MRDGLRVQRGEGFTTRKGEFANRVAVSIRLICTPEESPSTNPRCCRLVPLHDSAQRIWEPFTDALHASSPQRGS
jgi:hypothetical protein